ncbi:hypothetical protein [Photorhabdus heterorhabditis]|uniref:PAAR domain-containing protein n=1 Tax=Photorhabdus heterorhabditis TaxID=880156 RepID=A0A5B0X779_9GAMM|nr:hypothetical protein [Photorhabdus heterorhabditis]KAA1195092.1 hypothetical protein F0L16_03440 [Photorhabdus heterorhabditis]
MENAMKIGDVLVPPSCHPRIIAASFSTVLIEGKSAAKTDDVVSCSRGTLGNDRLNISQRK